MAQAQRLLGVHVARIRVEAEQVRLMRRTLLGEYRAALVAAVRSAAKNGGTTWTWPMAARARMQLEAASITFGRRVAVAVGAAGESQFVTGAEAFVGRIVGRRVELPYLRRSLFSIRNDLSRHTGENLVRYAQALSVNGAVLEKKVAEVEREIASQATKRAANLSERVISTEATRAMADGALMVASTIGIAMVWDSTLDMRVCAQCRSMHGRTITPKDERPPMHPRCRCVLVPEFALNEADAEWTAADLDEIASELGEPRTSSGFPWYMLLALAVERFKEKQKAIEEAEAT